MNNYRGLCNYRFEYYNGIKWVDFDELINKMDLPARYGESHREIAYVKFSVSAWTGPRQIRVTSVRHRTMDVLTAYHQLAHWDGATSTSTFCNTNLIVYSIM